VADIWGFEESMEKLIGATGENPKYQSLLK
jgi:hypothetical protein